MRAFISGCLKSKNARCNAQSYTNVKRTLFTVTIYRREGLTTVESQSSFHRTAVTLSILGGKISTLSILLTAHIRKN